MNFKMIDEKQLTQLLESFDLPLDKIDEIVLEFKKIDENPEPSIKAMENKGYAFSEGAIKEEMLNETDWKKRAVIAAKIISMGLD